MANSPAMVVKNLLVTANVGTFASTSGWSIHVSNLPNKPDTCIAVYDTGGQAPNPKFLLNYPGITITVRGAEGGYEAAYDKATAVVNALIGLPSQTIGSDRWVSVTMRGGINFVGQDENKRPMFSLNFSLIIEPNSGTYREEV
jgi:hypothetical protein